MSTPCWTPQPTKPRSVNPFVLERLTRNSIPGILCGIVILILTGLPGSCFPRVKPALGLDKVVHILMYAGFAFCCIWGYRQQFISNGITYKKRALSIACIISVFYGGFTELLQEYLVPSRTGDWFDFLSDTIGTLFGISVFYLFFKNRK